MKNISEMIKYGMKSKMTLGPEGHLRLGKQRLTRIDKLGHIRTSTTKKVTKRKKLGHRAEANAFVSEHQEAMTRAIKANDLKEVNRHIDMRVGNVMSYRVAIEKSIDPKYDYKSNGRSSPNKRKTLEDCDHLVSTVYSLFNHRDVSTCSSRYRAMIGNYYNRQLKNFFKSPSVAGYIKDMMIIPSHIERGIQNMIFIIVDPLIQDRLSPRSYWRRGRDVRKLARVFLHEIDTNKVQSLVHIKLKITDLGKLNQYVLNQVPGKDMPHYAILESRRGRKDLTIGTKSFIETGYAQWIVCKDGPADRVTSGRNMVDQIPPLTSLLWNRAVTDLHLPNGCHLYTYGDECVLSIQNASDLDQVISNLGKVLSARGREWYDDYTYTTIWGRENDYDTHVPFKFMGYKLHDGRSILQGRKKQQGTHIWSIHKSQKIHDRLITDEAVKRFDQIVKQVCHPSITGIQAITILAKRIKPFTVQYHQIPWIYLPTSNVEKIVGNWIDKKNEKVGRKIYHFKFDGDEVLSIYVYGKYLINHKKPTDIELRIQMVEDNWNPYMDKIPEEDDNRFLRI